MISLQHARDTSAAIVGVTAFCTECRWRGNEHKVLDPFPVHAAGTGSPPASWRLSNAERRALELAELHLPRCRPVPPDSEPEAVQEAIPW